MLPHRKLRGVVAYTSQTFPKTTPEASFSFNNVKKWTSVAGYAVNKIPGLAGEMPGAFHLGKTPGNFGGSKSGISDW